MLVFITDENFIPYCLLSRIDNSIIIETLNTVHSFTLLEISSKISLTYISRLSDHG